MESYFRTIQVPLRTFHKKIFLLYTIYDIELVSALYRIQWVTREEFIEERASVEVALGCVASY